MDSQLTLGIRAHGVDQPCNGQHEGVISSTCHLANMLNQSTDDLRVEFISKVT